MTSYLAYSYSVNLRNEEKLLIDQRVENNRKEFSSGFQTGIQLSLAVYFLFGLFGFMAKPAFADNLPARGNCPVNPAGKPGFRPLDNTARGTYLGGASGVSLAALQSGDFALGLACSILLLIVGIVLNRPHQ